MKGIRAASTLFGIAVVATTLGCANLTRDLTQREQTAALGGLAGGAGGAIIGSFAGSAVAGGLFGMPIGAVAGWYIGDQMARSERARDARIEENQNEIERLRRENERLRREADDRRARAAQEPPEREQDIRGSAQQQRPMAEQDITSSRPETSGSQATSSPSVQQGAAGSQTVSATPTQVREAQRKLNDMGFRAGQVDGVWGPQTQAALRNFQQSKGLETTGRLNQQTMKALGLE